MNAFFDQKTISDVAVSSQKIQHIHDNLRELFLRRCILNTGVPKHVIPQVLFFIPGETSDKRYLLLTHLQETEKKLNCYFQLVIKWTWTR